MYMDEITIESMKPSCLSVYNYDHLRTETFNSRECINKEHRENEAIGNFRLLQPDKVKSVQLIIGCSVINEINAKFHDMSQPLKLFKSPVSSDTDDNKIKVFHTSLSLYSNISLLIVPYDSSDQLGYSVDFYRCYLPEYHLPHRCDITVNNVLYHQYNAQNTYPNGFNGLTTALYISVDATGPIHGVTMTLCDKNNDNRLDFKYNERLDMWMYQWDVRDDAPFKFQLPNLLRYNTYRIEISKDDNIMCSNLTVGHEYVNELLCINGTVGLRFAY